MTEFVVVCWCMIMILPIHMFIVPILVLVVELVVFIRFFFAASSAVVAAAVFQYSSSLGHS